MISEQSRFPNNYLETHIYVNPGRGTELSGAMRHVATNRAWRYDNLVELLMLYEALFNSENYPQATHRLRDFSADVDVRERDLALLNGAAIDDEQLSAIGEPVFSVNVRHRQSATWQGSVSRIPSGSVVSFQSALELVKIMADSLNAERDSNNDDDVNK